MSKPIPGVPNDPAMSAAIAAGKQITERIIKDGSVPVAEMETQSRAFVAALASYADKLDGKDGSIDLNKLGKEITKNAKLTSQQDSQVTVMLLSMFDGKHEISTAELRTKLNSSIEKLLRDVDKNNDWKIDLNELPGMLGFSNQAAKSKPGKGG